MAPRMELPHNFTPEHVEKAIRICEEADAARTLRPRDAYDVVFAVSGSMRRGDSVPGTLGEVMVARDVLKMTGYELAD
jgi:hypothetical protein